MPRRDPQSTAVVSTVFRTFISRIDRCRSYFFKLPPFGAFVELVDKAPDTIVLADVTDTIRLRELPHVGACRRVSDHFGIAAYHIEVGIPVFGLLHQKRARLVPYRFDKVAVDFDSRASCSPASRPDV